MFDEVSWQCAWNDVTHGEHFFRLATLATRGTQDSELSRSFSLQFEDVSPCTTTSTPSTRRVLSRLVLICRLLMSCGCPPGSSGRSRPDREISRQLITSLCVCASDKCEMNYDKSIWESAPVPTSKRGPSIRVRKYGNGFHFVVDIFLTFINRQTLQTHSTHEQW